MNDLFERIIKNKGPLGKWASIAEGYFVFPKLEGPIANRMKFNGKEVITCLLYTSPSPRDMRRSRMPSSA